MSRIGKLPIDMPQGVSLTVEDGVVKVVGPKGQLEQEIRPEVTVAVNGQQIVVERIDDS